MTNNNTMRYYEVACSTCWHGQARTYLGVGEALRAQDKHNEYTNCQDKQGAQVYLVTRENGIVKSRELFA